MQFGIIHSVDLQSVLGMILLNCIMILHLDTFNNMLTHLKRIMILATLLLLSITSPSHKVEAKVKRCIHDSTSNLTYRKHQKV